MIYIISLTLLVISSIIINSYRKKNKKLQINYNQVKDSMNLKFTELFGNYYTLSKAYLKLAIEHINYDPEYITKVYAVDRDAIMGMVCVDMSVLKEETLNYISDMLLEKIYKSGEDTLTFNEKLFLDITSGKVK